MAFPIFTTLHNLEEAVFLYKLENDPKYKLWCEKKVRLWILLIVFTLLAYVVTLLYIENSGGRLKYLYYGYVGVMLFNSVFPHIIIAIISKRYIPGVYTAVINLLSFSWIIFFALHADLIKAWGLIVSSLIVGIILIFVMRITFLSGKFGFRR